MNKLSRRQKESLEQRIRLNMELEQDKLFGVQEKERFHVGKETRNTILLGVFLAVVFVLSVLLTGNLTRPEFSLAWVAKYSMRRINDIVDLFAGNHLQSGIHFFICQFISPVVAGLALGAAGACFQGLFHNPMASPTLLGIEHGGALGSTVYVLFFYSPALVPMISHSYGDYALEYYSMTFMQRYGQYVFTLAGCLVVVIAVMFIAKISRRGRLETVPLMIGGTIFSTTIASTLTVIQYYESTVGGNSAAAMEIRNIQAGRFEAVSTPELVMYMTIPIVFSLVIMMLMRGRLNVISFGEEEAKLMGVNVKFDRIILIFLATIMTAAVVAFCGVITFVGLIVPHFARILVGNDFKHLIPASAFSGAIFMLLAFDASYMSNMYLNASSVVSVLGGAIFIIFMMRYRRRGHADWA